MVDKKFLIEEYNSLRSEVLKQQEVRYVVLGFTVTAVGVLLAQAIKQDIVLAKGPNIMALSMMGYAFVIIISAALVASHHTQNIDRLAGYIREFIEPEIPEIKWETRWHFYRESHRKLVKQGRLPFGTSKCLAVYYSLLTLAVAVSCVALGAFTCWTFAIIVSVLFILSGIVISDLYFRWTGDWGGWKIKWEIFRNCPLDGRLKEDKEKAAEGGPGASV